MAKLRSVHRCSDCGQSTPKWAGRCPSCGAWNTLVEDVEEVGAAPALHLTLLPSGRPLRACHPRDLLDQVSALCRYRGIEPTISHELLDAACASYFIDNGAH